MHAVVEGERDGLVLSVGDDAIRVLVFALPLRWPVLDHVYGMARVGLDDADLHRVLTVVGVGKHDRVAVAHRGRDGLQCAEAVASSVGTGEPDLGKCRCERFTEWEVLRDHRIEQESALARARASECGDSLGAVRPLVIGDLEGVPFAGGSDDQMPALVALGIFGHFDRLRGRGCTRKSTVPCSCPTRHTRLAVTTSAGFGCVQPASAPTAATCAFS